MRFRVSHGSKITEYEFDRERIEVGRGPFNDIVLEDEALGRVFGAFCIDEAGHLALECEPGGNGVALTRSGLTEAVSDGETSVRLPLMAGDIVSVEADAPLKIEVLETDSSAEEAPAMWAFDQSDPAVDAASVLRRLAARLVRESTPAALIEAASELLADAAQRVFFVLVRGPQTFGNDAFVMNASTCAQCRDPLATVNALGDLEASWLRDPHSMAVLDGRVLVPVMTPQGLGAVFVIEHESLTDSRLAAIASVATSVVPFAGIHLQRARLEHAHRVVVEENRYFRARERQHYLFKELICESESMRQLHERLAHFSDTDDPVLIAGEAGTGKELLARALHHLGGRAPNMIIHVNCSRLSPGELDIELFGCTPSEALGTDVSRKGVFELARDGTVFLEEIDVLPPLLQGKLARMLKESEVRRIGESVGRPVRTRLVSSLHRDLQSSVDSGRLRRDLYLLLKDQTLTVPALRDRVADIVPLARNFAHVYGERYALPGRELSAESEAALRSYGWPGNVRELQSRIEAAVLHAPGNVLRPRDLGL